MIDAEQIAAHADGPGDRGALDFQHAFNFIQQFDRSTAVPIQLVNERHDGRVAQPAYIHEFDGPLFNALGAVNYHQGRINRRERPIGILGEILVAGCVQQIHDAIIEGELHHRGGHGNAALLLQPHPGGVTRRLAALDRARHLNSAAKQQQFFGERGLARVWMGDDCKSSSSAYFVGQ